MAREKKFNGTHLSIMLKKMYQSQQIIINNMPNLVKKVASKLS